MCTSTTNSNIDIRYQHQDVYDVRTSCVKKKDMQPFQVRIKIIFSSEVSICILELKSIEQTASAFIILVRGNTTSLLPSIAIVLVSSILLFRQTSKERVTALALCWWVCPKQINIFISLFFFDPLLTSFFLGLKTHQCPQFWSAQETPCQTPGSSCCSTDLQTFWYLQVSKKIFYSKF